MRIYYNELCLNTPTLRMPFVLTLNRVHADLLTLCGFSSNPNGSIATFNVPSLVHYTNGFVVVVVVVVDS